jgi:putative transposase
MWNQGLVKDIGKYWFYAGGKQFKIKSNHLSRFNIQKYLDQLRKDNFLNRNINSRLTKMVSKDLAEAFQKFFSHKGGYPKFKSISKTKLSFTTDNISLKDNGWSLFLPKIGKIKLNKKITKDINVRRCTVEYIPNRNRYYVSILVTTSFKQLPYTYDSIGFDWGEKTFLTGSTALEESFKINPPILKAFSKRKKLISVKDSITNNGCKYNRLVKRISKLNDYIVNYYKDYYHWLTTNLVRKYDYVAIEKLNYKQLHQQGVRVSKVKKQAWMFGKFKEYISYKLKNYRDTELIEVPAKNTTVMCSNCSSLTGPKQNLSIRSWICSKCNTEHDRDINTSKNILNKRIGRYGLRPITCFVSGVDLNV